MIVGAANSKGTRCYYGFINRYVDCVDDSCNHWRREGCNVASGVAAAPAAPKELSDDELVARVTGFAEAFAAVVAATGAECAVMGDALEGVLAANQDILALSARLEGEDAERKERLKARVKPVTDGIMAPHMEALQACGDEPKVTAVLERMPAP